MEIYLLLLLLLVLSGIFSGLEIAFVSSNKFKIELVRESKSISDKILSKFAFNDSLFITTLLIGNNIVLVVFGHFMAEKLIGDFGYSNLLIQTIITTLIVLVFGEFIPKTIFSIAPNTILKYFAIPINIIYIPFQYLAKVFNYFSLKLVGAFIEINDKYEEQFSSSDLKHYIKGLIDEENNDDDDDEINTEFFEKAIDFKDIRVKECMVPRTELSAISSETSIKELPEIFINEKHSRVLVYKESIDDIIGYVHHFDLFKNPIKLDDITYKITSVPETMNARDLLTIFTSENKNIAHVFDEHGGTSGIITMEDLMEEIFGEIEDEHDSNVFQEEYDEKTGLYTFSARLEVDYINETHNLEIPEGDYETLAGFIVVRNEDIPSEGEMLELEDFRINILKADNNRLELVSLKKIEN